MNIIDTKYATTRMLISDKPEIVDVNNAKFSNQLFWIDNKIDFIESGLRTQGYFKKSTDQKPLITIITIVFNDEKFIEQTILSILTQTYANVEYIIIDGGSTDKTVDILKKYNDQIDYWISGKDNGIYDAMNRGIQLAQGEMIGLINSGDYCDQNALESFAAACSSKIACYYTDNFIVFDSMKMVTRKKASFNYRRGTDYLPPSPKELDAIFEEGSNEIKQIRHPIIQALSYFLFGARTQFFYDGNKRVSRLMMNGILLKAGYPMLNIKAKDKLEFNTQMIAFYDSGDYVRALEYLRDYYTLKNSHIKQ